MSHKATNWLSDIPADALGHSEFRVLFHLCDCHNPSQGCFPTQAYLLEVTGLANSTLNVALGNMEKRGLIERRRGYDREKKRSLPTRYILGFEIKRTQGQTPETGDSKEAGQTPETGGRADSDLPPDQTPISGQSRLRHTGEKPVKEPVKNRAGAGASDDPLGAAAAFWADQIGQGKHVAASAVSIQVADRMIASRLVEAAKLRELGIAFSTITGQ